MIYPIKTATGVIAQAHQPTADVVLDICDQLVRGVAPWPFVIPSSAEVRWTGSQREWMLPVLSGAWHEAKTGKPGTPIAQRIADVNRRYLRWIVEAYMTRVEMPDGAWLDYEQTTDGASWFPDPPWNHTHFVKWFIAVAHDQKFDQNHAHVPDVLGHYATWDESIDFMRVCMIAENELGWMTRKAVVAAVESPLAKAWWNMEVK